MWGRNNRVYLDHASGTKVVPEALRAYRRAVGVFGNPSSPHQEGRDAALLLADARRVIAREVEAKPDDIIFTSGATEANNIAITGVVMAAKAKGITPHVLYLPSAHASLVEPVRALASWGVAVEPLVVSDGAIDLVRLKAQIRPETVLVVMERVCGETGVIWNTRGVRHVLDARIVLHVDASHAPRIESIERTRLAGDTIVFDAQKLGGVRGVGVLIAPRTLPLVSCMHGGGQERGIRPGTENVAAIAACAAAFVVARKQRVAFARRAATQRDHVRAALSLLSEAGENTGKEQAPHILNMSLVGRDTDYLVALLDARGFAVSTKSACETDSGEGSRAVQVLSGDIARTASTLRVSFGYETTMRDARRFVRACTKAVAFLDAHAL